MTRACLFALLLAATGVSPAPPRERWPFVNGESVEVVGRITSPAQVRLYTRVRRKIQVAVGPGAEEVTLHFQGAEIYGAEGEKRTATALRVGWWVLAEGQVMKIHRRIHVSWLQVIARDRAGFEQTEFFRKGGEGGYIRNVAGVGQIFDHPRPFREGMRLAVLGEVAPAGENAPTIENQVQVAVGPQRKIFTLYLENTRFFGLEGRRILAGSLRVGMWVRAEGALTRNEREVVVQRLWVLGTDREGYREGPFWRPHYAQGYLVTIGHAGETPAYSF